MSADSVMPEPAAYKDRRTMCIVLGAFEILLGFACVALIPLILLVTGLSHAGLDVRALAFSVAFYGLMAVACVWLGIGSILCRRWARTLLLILGWSWLVMGVTSLLVILAVLLAGWLRYGLTEPAVLVFAAVIMAVFALFFMVLPAVLIVFYQSKSVQATFEARDTRPAWTDTCPVPVLTTALWLAYGAVSIVLVVGLHGSVVPFFGRLVSEPPASVLLLAAAVVSLWLAWAFYRLQTVGLWVAIALSVISCASGVLTFTQVDFIEVYRLMDYPEAQINAIRDVGLFGSRAIIVWVTGLMGAATIAFLLWLRRYFPHGAQDAL